VIAGVCGGIGWYLGVDPVLIRIAFVVLTVAGGSGVLLFGGVLIAIGVILILGLALPRVGKYFWPLILIALGVAIIVQASARR
jgi:phage shock protein PspC (stress-responsive transcriptional regulator)